MSIFNQLFGKSDEPFTAFDDALVTAKAAIDASEISRTDYNTLRRCYGAMSDESKRVFSRAMEKPIVEDGDGIFNENGRRIG